MAIFVMVVGPPSGARTACPTANAHFAWTDRPGRIFADDFHERVRKQGRAWDSSRHVAAVAPASGFAAAGHIGCDEFPAGMFASAGRLAAPMTSFDVRAVDTPLVAMSGRIYRSKRRGRMP